jgi:hypothetical protein
MQNQSSSSSRQLKDHFASIADPRTGPAQRHELLDILLIAVCAMLCGAESFTDIALWGRCQHDWLKTWLALPNGIPSHDTFHRVFGLLAPSEFAACFQSWTQALRQAVAGEWIAIDGTTLRGRRSKTQGPVHLVNVWAASHRLVLAQLAVDDKRNEITAVPQLLRAVELTGGVVTVEALNCQKNIAKEISEADADYVLALKGNHGTLPEAVQCFLDDAQRRGWRAAFVCADDGLAGRQAAVGEVAQHWLGGTGGGEGRESADRTGVLSEQPAGRGGAVGGGGAWALGRGERGALGVGRANERRPLSGL